MPGSPTSASPLKTALARLRALGDGSDFTTLVAEAQALCADHPRNPFAQRMLAQGLAGLGRTAEAHAALDRAEALGLPGKVLWRDRMNLEHRTRNWTGIVAATENFQRLGGEASAADLEHHCEALVELGQAGKASALADTMLERFPNQRLGIRAKFRALTALHGAEGIAPACENWLRDPGGEPARGFILKLLGIHVPELKAEAQAILNRLHADNPENPIMLLAMQAMSLTRDDTGALIPRSQDLSRRMSTAGSVVDRLSLAVTEGAKGVGYAREALVERVKTEFAGIDLQRPLIDDDPGSEVVRSQVDGPGGTAIVFTGMNDRFGVPLVLLDAYFAARGISAIYLRDTRKTLFLGGLHALGEDVAATVDALRGMLPQGSGAPDLTVYGSSGGGIAALRYGVALGARRIVGVAAATTATEEFATRAGDTRGRLLTSRLYAMFGQDALCGRRALEAAANPPRVDLVFGAEAPFDAAHAHELQDLENAHLFAIPGLASHHAAYDLFQRGLMGDLVDGRLAHGLRPKPT